ncbi:WG repeat-containing protein [Burkholderia sp. Bp9125]|nr:WG repeat-containing protein [Burkholderia sp. Bp9125]
MGNRAWLYLQAGAGDDRRTIEFAEANNHFPMLWRVLLADGYAGDPITLQRVFGDAGTPNLVSDARAAHARIGRLAAFVAAYPLRGDGPALARQFDAVVRHLGEQIDALGDAHGAPLLSANLDELSWFEDGDPDDFIEAERAACTGLWWRIGNCIDFRDERGVRDALEIGRAPDWDEWVWHFGFGGMSHVYFARQDPPRGVGYADFVGDGITHGDYLDYELYSFRARNGLWGARRDAGDTWEIVVPPEWTGLWRSGARDWRLVWAARDERVGLMRFDDDGPRIVHEPAFDEVWDFDDDVACVRVGDKLGLVRMDGTWVLEPLLDTLGDFVDGLARACVDGRWGFVEPGGTWVIPPQFDDAQDGVNGEAAAVRDGEQWGIVGRDGQWRARPEWTSLEWSAGCDAYLAQRGGHMGAVDLTGRVVVEPRYAKVAALTDGARMEALRYVVWRDDARCAIVDGEGRVLTPFDFTNAGALQWLPGDDDVPAALRARHAVGVMPGEPASLAVCDLATGVTIALGRHDDVAGLHWGADHGWLACRYAEGGDDVRATVFRADGTVLHPARYTRIADAALFDADAQHDAGASCLMPWYIRRVELAQSWAAGEPVAALRDDGVPVWLHADGRVDAPA